MAGSQNHCLECLTLSPGKAIIFEELSMKVSVPMESASAVIDEKIKELGDRRGKTLANVHSGKATSPWMAEAGEWHI
jgi:hypothetical protein